MLTRADRSSRSPNRSAGSVAPASPRRPRTNNSIALEARRDWVTALSQGDQAPISRCPARWCPEQGRSCGGGNLPQNGGRARAQIPATRTRLSTRIRRQRACPPSRSRAASHQNGHAANGVLCLACPRAPPRTFLHRRRQPDRPPNVRWPPATPLCRRCFERRSRHAPVVAGPQDGCRSLRCRPSPTGRRTTSLAERRQDRDRLPQDAGGRMPPLPRHRPRPHCRLARGAPRTTPSSRPGLPAGRRSSTRSGRGCRLFRTWGVNRAFDSREEQPRRASWRKGRTKAH